MFLLDKKTWYAIIKVIQENLAKNGFLPVVLDVKVILYAKCIQAWEALL